MRTKYTIKSQDIDNVIRSLRIAICDDNHLRSALLHKQLKEYGLVNIKVVSFLDQSVHADLIFAGGKKADKAHLKPVKGKAPIVFLVDNNTSEIFQAYMQGAAHVLSYPFKAEDVSECLWSAVRYRGQTADANDVVCWKNNCLLRVRPAF